MGHPPPQHKPYTHQIRGLPNNIVVLRGLRRAGFTINDSDYEWANPAGPGTKTEGQAPALFVVFPNRQHADHARLALNGKILGGARIICERAPASLQKSDPDPRAQERKIPAMKVLLVLTTLEPPLIYTIFPAVEQEYNLELDAAFLKGPPPVSAVRPQKFYTSKGKQYTMSDNILAEEFGRWVRYHWNDGPGSPFSEVQSKCGKALALFQQGKGQDGKPLGKRVIDFKGLDPPQECIMYNYDRAPFILSIQLPANGGCGHVWPSNKGVILPSVNIRPLTAYLIKEKNERLFQLGAFGLGRFNGEMSHLCHNGPYCHNIDHLIIESATMNQSRSACVANGKCICKGQQTCRLDLKMTKEYYEDCIKREVLTKRKTSGTSIY